MVDIIEKLGLKLLNKDKILLHTHGTYNCFNIEFPSIYNTIIGVEPTIKLELVYIERSYPTKIKEASFYIAEFLENNSRNDLIEKYELEPFNIWGSKTRKNIY